MMAASGLAWLRDAVRTALLATGGDRAAAVPFLVRALNNAANRGGERMRLLAAFDAVLDGGDARSGDQGHPISDARAPWLARPPLARAAQAVIVLARVAPDLASAGAR
jgi:hypothetical protein